MDVSASIDLPCDPRGLFIAMDDLGGYPEWLGLVARVSPTDADPGDPGPAWDVELRGRLGPMARSKRLRMVRTTHTEPKSIPAPAHGSISGRPASSRTAPGQIVFERRELDGRDHSPWRLAAEIMACRDGALLVMHLHYGGAFGGRSLERVLAEEIDRSRPRLRAWVLAGSASCD